MSLSVTQIQDGIKKLGIVGVKRIYTSADAPREVLARDLPILMPDPTKPVESSTSQRQTLSATTLAGRYGGGWVRMRTLNYVCLVSALGADRKPAANGEKLAQVMDAVENALCDFRMSDIHFLTNVSVSDVGVMQDAVSAGIDPTRAQQFLGFLVQVTVTTSY